MAKTSVIISGLAAIAVVGGLAYWGLSGDENSVPIPASVGTVEDTNTVAYQWQWENFTDDESVAALKPTGDSDSEEESSPPAGDVPYDVVAIYDILQGIQLDQDGRLVPDQTAKQALEKGFADLGPDLSPESMAELQDLIRTGLPGEAGEEAAILLENYFQFRRAEEEFNRYLPKDGQLPSIESYEKIVQLRYSFMSPEVVDQLFVVEDTQARHMLAVMALHQNTELSEEEKAAQGQALQEELNDRLLALGQLGAEDAARTKVRHLREAGASNEAIYAAREELLGEARARELAAADREEELWQSRFEGFWQAHQQVVQAGLAEAESERQIQQLLNQYFSPAERERARLTIIERQVQSSR